MTNIDALRQDVIDSLVTNNVSRFIHVSDNNNYDCRSFVFIQYDDGKYRLVYDLVELIVDEFVSKDEGNDFFKRLMSDKRCTIVSKIFRER